MYGWGSVSRHFLALSTILFAKNLHLFSHSQWVISLFQSKARMNYIWMRVVTSANLKVWNAHVKR